jgi:hypothetical protein
VVGDMIGKITFYPCSDATLLVLGTGGAVRPEGAVSKARCPSYNIVTTAKLLLWACVTHLWQQLQTPFDGRHVTRTC